MKLQNFLKKCQPACRVSQFDFDAAHDALKRLSRDRGVVILEAAKYGDTLFPGVQKACAMLNLNPRAGRLVVEMLVSNFLSELEEIEAQAEDEAPEPVPMDEYMADIGKQQCKSQFD